MHVLKGLQDFANMGAPMEICAGIAVGLRAQARNPKTQRAFPARIRERRREFPKFQENKQS